MKLAKAIALVDQKHEEQIETIACNAHKCFLRIKEILSEFEEQIAFKQDIYYPRDLADACSAYYSISLTRRLKPFIPFFEPKLEIKVPYVYLCCEDSEEVTYHYRLNKAHYRFKEQDELALAEFILHVVEELKLTMTKAMLDAC